MNKRIAVTCFGIVVWEVNVLGGKTRMGVSTCRETWRWK